MIDSGAYAWLSTEAGVGLGEAGCVTVIAATTPDAALAAFGAEGRVVPVEPEAWARAPYLAGIGELPGGVVVVEPNGFQGARREVLRRVSKLGVAATVQWDVNGAVYVGCARKGRVVCLVDLLLDGDLEGVPARLKRLVPDDRVKADLLSVGAAMVQTYVGVGFGPHDVARIKSLHELVPVLSDLQLLPPSMSMLRHDAPELLDAIVAANTPTRWALAQWAAREAVRTAELVDDERVAGSLDRFDTQQQVQVTTGVSELAQLTEREWLMAEARDPFRTPDQGPQGLEYMWAWQRKTAIDALRYCGEADDLLAAVGAVEAAVGCASINGARSDFVAEASRLLTIDPARWASEARPLPDPPTAADREAALEEEQVRAAAHRAREARLSGSAFE